MNPVAALVDFALAPHVLPAEVRADAERLLADTLAGGAAGAVSSETVKLRDAVGSWGVGSEARLLSGGTASAQSAAFFNGFAIHCLEWDAVHEPAVVHALSVVLAALLAASDRRGGSDPGAFLTALAVGVDVASGLGLSATGPMKFFRPATAGVIGAALAVARFDGLDRVAATSAVGLAYSFAGGTMQAHVEGSVALPLQIGQAARSALTAIDLAKAGMDGPHDVLTGPFGYATLIEPIDLTDYLAGLGKVWRISEVSIKSFPTGRASHGLLSVIANLTLTDTDVITLTHYAPPLVLRLVGRDYRSDMSSAYARLCGPFLAALMLKDGRIDPRRFEASTFSDPEIAELAKRIAILPDSNDNQNVLSPQRCLVKLFDGHIEVEIPDTLGSPAAPLSAAQAKAKYDLCRELAPLADQRLFNAPLAYATEPA